MPLCDKPVLPQLLGGIVENGYPCPSRSQDWSLLPSARSQAQDVKTFQTTKPLLWDRFRGRQDDIPNSYPCGSDLLIAYREGPLVSPFYLFVPRRAVVLANIQFYSPCGLRKFPQHNYSLSALQIFDLVHVCQLNSGDIVYERTGYDLSFLFELVYVKMSHSFLGVRMVKETRTQKRTATETSSFGTPGHINHDSTKFYKSRLYEGIRNSKKVKYIENKIPDKNINRFFCKSSEKMDELPDNSIHLMVTSPPYNVSKEYDDDLSLNEYLNLLNTVWEETYRVLVPGGRACINVANLGRKPYIPLHSYIIEGMQELGYLMRGEIIWNKASSASPSTAWGSWLSAANPVLRDIHEYILIFSKETFSRIKEDRENTITKGEFLEWTKSVWTFPAVSAKQVGHPAPFPEELPYRLIQLYTFKGDVILDPFAGSGSTCLSAIKNERNYVGYDIDSDYVKLAEKRILNYRSQLRLFE
jgi:site-specific DNA-methyltransferase (adenine-specific)